LAINWFLPCHNLHNLWAHPQPPLCPAPHASATIRNSENYHHRYEIKMEWLLMPLTSERRNVAGRRAGGGGECGRERDFKSIFADIYGASLSQIDNGMKKRKERKVICGKYNLKLKLSLPMEDCAVKFIISIVARLRMPRARESLISRESVFNRQFNRHSGCFRVVCL
jgi:hypothetical protein